jgi:hypothetical protein
MSGLMAELAILIIEKFFALNLSIDSEDYRYNESCLYIANSKINSASHLSNVPINILFDKNLKWLDKLVLQQFHIDCGVNAYLVKTAIYSKLSNVHFDQFKSFYESSCVDLNTLAWMTYHKVDFTMYKECVDYKQKRDCTNLCIICRATANVIIFDNRKTTISPITMSGSRARMTYSSAGGFHYVVWSRTHITLPQKDFYDFYKCSHVGCGELYFHIEPQYGHPHVHCMYGNYHNIRAGELLHSLRNKIKKGCVITTSDFYLPLNKFYHNCDSTGQDYILASLLLVHFRVDLSFDDLEFTDFILCNYESTVNVIRNYFNLE